MNEELNSLVVSGPIILYSKSNLFDARRKLTSKIVQVQRMDYRLTPTFISS